MGQAEAHPYPIVGVGASAGGLTPLKELVSALPPAPGVALVIVQHLDPHAESHLGRLLQPHTSMEVVSAVHGTRVAPNQIYVIQPNTNVAVTDGILTVTPRPDDRRPYYPIDHFFRSLAMVQGPHAVGVVLSGTGSDGTLGICEIKAAGGVTFAQDETAQHTGMPHSAIGSGAVDLVLPPSAIGSRIAELPRHPFLSGGQPPERIVEDGDDFDRVMAALRRTSGVDFSQYRDTTIKRRTARRMLLRGVNSPKDYAQTLETDRQEAEALYRDVLINVTSFFRDPEMFEILKCCQAGRKSNLPKYLRRINPRGARRGYPSRNKGDQAETQRGSEKCEWVVRRESVQQGCDETGKPERCRDSQAGASSDKQRDSTQHRPHDGMRPRAKGESNPDLRATAADSIRTDAVQPNRGQQDGDHSKESCQHRDNSLLCDRRVEILLKRSDRESHSRIDVTETSSKAGHQGGRIPACAKTDAERRVRWCSAGRLRERHIHGRRCCIAK